MYINNKKKHAHTHTIKGTFFEKLKICVKTLGKRLKYPRMNTTRNITMNIIYLQILLPIKNVAKSISMKTQ
jgi:hypothetical protein